jgi:hypothetical protein
LNGIKISNDRKDYDYAYLNPIYWDYKVEDGDKVDKDGWLFPGRGKDMFFRATAIEFIGIE